MIWDLWIPDAASRGVSFARGVGGETDAILVHAAPTKLRVEVTSEDGRRLAIGDGLERDGDSPMTLLTLTGNQVQRREVWPGEAELGMLVILPGGEIGTLARWWHSPEHREWRWTVEFHNRR